jgi:hypothetical protein
MLMKHFLAVCYILLYVNIRLRSSVVAYENQPVPQNLALVNHMVALTHLAMSQHYLAGTFQLLDAEIVGFNLRITLTFSTAWRVTNERLHGSVQPVQVEPLNLSTIRTTISLSDILKSNL